MMKKNPEGWSDELVAYACMDIQRKLRTIAREAEIFDPWAKDELRRIADRFKMKAVRAKKKIELTK